MAKTICLVFVLLFGATQVSRAQDGATARLRVMQLSYIPESSAVVDVEIDGVVVFEAISWPFVTDYTMLPPGDHRLVTRSVVQESAVASATLHLEAGKSYSVIATGTYPDAVTFIVVEDPPLPPNATGSTASIVNLTGASITQITLNGNQVLEAIVADSYGIVTLPVAEFTMSATLGDQTFTETYTPHANTDFLIAVRLLPSGEPQAIYHRSSELTIADYLRTVDAGAQFSRAAGWIAQTNLLDTLHDDQMYTVFLPVNAALDKAASPPHDAGELRALLANHVVAGNLPPYRLTDSERLPTLAGGTVGLNFGATDSGYWEIAGVPILWDVRLANGVIYGIDGVVIAQTR